MVEAVEARDKGSVCSNGWAPRTPSAVYGMGRVGVELLEDKQEN